jgi:hypothetical protein
MIVATVSTRSTEKPPEDRALDWLERAVSERTGPAYGIKGSFVLASLHAHPRCRALLQQMRLA